MLSTYLTYTSRRSREGIVQMLVQVSSVYARNLQVDRA
jgi:hypothetical protein